MIGIGFSFPEPMEFLSHSKGPIVLFVWPSKVVH